MIKKYDIKVRVTGYIPSAKNESGLLEVERNGVTMSVRINAKKTRKPDAGLINGNYINEALYEKTKDYSVILQGVTVDPSQPNQVSADWIVTNVPGDENKIISSGYMSYAVGSASARNIDGGMASIVGVYNFHGFERADTQHLMALLNDSSKAEMERQEARRSMSSDHPSVANKGLPAIMLRAINAQGQVLDWSSPASYTAEKDNIHPINGDALIKMYSEMQEKHPHCTIEVALGVRYQTTHTGQIGYNRGKPIEKIWSVAGAHFKNDDLPKLVLGVKGGIFFLSPGKDVIQRGKVIKQGGHNSFVSDIPGAYGAGVGNLALMPSQHYPRPVLSEQYQNIEVVRPAQVMDEYVKKSARAVPRI